jgi:transcription antitermination protein NusB
MATSRRRQTREKVLQVLYAHELSGEPILPIMEEQLAELKPNRDDFEFAKALVHTVLQHLREIDKIIKSKVMHWESDRIAVIDRMILRMGIAELLYFPDIPPKVTINEAIEIGKVFSTSNSGRFINGVLDAILEQMRESGTLQKSGRGLLEFSVPHETKPPTTGKPRQGK